MYIVYGKPGCSYCKRALDLLNQSNLTSVYIDVSLEQNSRKLEEFKEMGLRTVPQVYFNDQHIGGYEDLVNILSPSVSSPKRTVIKRNGEEAVFEADKINAMAEWATPPTSNVQWSEVVMNAMEKLEGTKLTSKNIQQALIKSCLDKDTESHNKIAGRLLLADLRKETLFGLNEFPSFYAYMVENNYWIDMKLDYAQLRLLGAAIDHDIDFKYGYPTLRQLSDKHLIRNEKGQLLEHPQFLYMGIAMTRFVQYGLDEVIAYYSKIANHKINLPSPQLSTVRTPSNGGVSCAVITGGDSLHGIETAKHVAFLATAASAGIGIEMDVRSPKDDVRNGYAKAGGKLPHYRSLSAIVKEVRQSDRGGSATVTFTCIDPEINNLLKIKLPRTADERKVDKLDYSLAVNNSFLRRAAKRQEWALVSKQVSPELYAAFYREDSDKFDEIMDSLIADSTVNRQVVNAFDILDHFLESRQEIGRYYQVNVNHANSHTPFDPDYVPIRQSNLCLEILLPTKEYGHMTELYKPVYEEGDGMVALCFLGAIDVVNTSEDEYEETCYLALKSLDDLIEDMDYPTPQIEAVAKNWRSVGVGITNLAQKLAKDGKSYKDVEYLHAIAERHYYYLLKASIRLAKERGKFGFFDKTRWKDGWIPLDTYNRNVDALASTYHYDWASIKQDVMTYGVRFSVICAHMPCESSSVVSNSTNSIYPIRNDMVFKDSKKGDIQFFAPNYDKYRYETVWDLTATDITNFYAVVQKFTDQAISADTYTDFSKYQNKQVPKSERTKNYLYWNKMGIKTMYYNNPKTGRGGKEEESDCASCKF